MTPALEPELETHLLRAALLAVFTLGTEKDATQVQDLLRVLPDILDAMLGNLLAESPGTDRLHYILEHINYWIMSRVSRERTRAIRSSMALLRSTITLPEFSNSAKFPRMGHHVSQLALFVSDPSMDISQRAREGVYRLYQLLLHQRGLTIHEAEDLWVWDWHQDSRLLGYKTTARVGEVFGKFFSEGQRRFFLQTAVLAIHHPLLHVSQAGLLLTYSLLGKGQQLMGDKVSSCIRLRRLGQGPGLIPILRPFAGLAARSLVGNEGSVPASHTDISCSQPSSGNSEDRSPHPVKPSNMGLIEAQMEDPMHLLEEQIFPGGGKAGLRGSGCRGWMLSEPLPRLVQQHALVAGGDQPLRQREWQQADLTFKKEDTEVLEVPFLETGPKNTTNMEQASVTMAAELKNHPLEGLKPLQTPGEGTPECRRLHSSASSRQVLEVVSCYGNTATQPTE
ncbi:uncharacterized protein LOC122457316 [Dermochelys coriacea]|uniref:uncharacterized protein LOC122457316 n=1 Tax=Dermochelys coriacea TaxID=27794 RepID=UPI001CA9FD0E|nr:uncharacterized protein LOC122457316 [Dermochelys coriacea]